MPPDLPWESPWRPPTTGYSREYHRAGIMGPEAAQMGCNYGITLRLGAIRLYISRMRVLLVDQ